MKARQAVKILEEDGWYHFETKGSHRHYKHSEKAGKVTVSAHGNDDIPKGTLASIFRQAQIRREREGGFL